MERISKALDSGKYRDVVHAQVRQQERQITRPEYTYVLRNGFHEARKDEYRPEYNAGITLYGVAQQTGAISEWSFLLTKMAC